MLISCISCKGGVGKTSVATNLACVAAREGSVLLVDADVQRSSLYWRSIRPGDGLFGEIQVVSMPTNALHKDLPKLSAGFDVTIIDCGGKDNNVLRSSILACGRGVVREEGGIAMMILSTSQFDLWGLTDTLDALREGRTFVDVPSCILLNNFMGRSKLAGRTLAAVSRIEDVPLLKSKLHSRIAFKIARESGKGVVEIEPRGKASAEVNALWRELVAFHNGLKEIKI